MPQGLFPPPGFISILLFFTTGIISTARIHLYLALSHHRDYCDRPDSSLSCSFSPQGLFLPLRCIPSLLFCTAGITATARIHLYLALFHCRDYCDRPDSSLSCSFVLQGLFPPPGFIPSLLFCAAGIISTARIHLYLALPCRRDDFFRSDASPACFFHHRDYFDRSDSSLSCFFLPQGLFLLRRFIPILLFFSAGIISSAQMHPQLAFLYRRDYCDRPDSSLSCSFSLQGLLRPPGFISILLFCAAGIISAARIHPQLAFLCRRDYFHRPDSSLSCSSVPQG